MAARREDVAVSLPMLALTMRSDFPADRKLMTLPRYNPPSSSATHLIA
jgi:hypothetical protein